MSYGRAMFATQLQQSHQSCLRVSASGWSKQIAGLVQSSLLSFPLRTATYICLSHGLQSEWKGRRLRQKSGARRRGGSVSRPPTCWQQESLTAQYEDRALQDAALRTVSLGDLEEKTHVALAKEGRFEVTEDEFQHARLQQLLFWFKKSFRWVDRPSCERCGGGSVPVGQGTPNPEDLKWLASRVELFRCSKCFSEVRFPRYNDPKKLLETRSGRCGEWANCFTLYCRALGYQTRTIQDFQDHVWTECYLPLLGRWVHADACEGVMDKPLLYEKGWKKKLNYVIALAHNGVHDVTKRYTRHWPEVLIRRTIPSEHQPKGDEAKEVIMSLNSQIRCNLSSPERDELAMFDAQEDDKIEESYQERPVDENQLPGRISGSEEWRVARGEIGNSNNSSSGSVEYPVRMCVDEHVKVIREAVGCLWSDVLKSSASVQKVILSLKALHAFLMKLKSQPFRKRELKLDSQTERAWLYEGSDQTINYLLQALGLQRSPREDGAFWVSEEGNPVKTALVLPVALELLERLTNDLPMIVTEKWLVHGSRLCKGVSCASGEHPPSGLSSSAFDGLVSTKWEEPKGAKGSWIVYHLSDGIHQKLAAYELTSANDVPDRDPRDWILEGSGDNGRSWRTLDSQREQVFEGRFVCKTYEITQQNQFPCDSFRLRVLSTKSQAKHVRLQIACIDLITFKV